MIESIMARQCQEFIGAAARCDPHTRMASPFIWEVYVCTFVSRGTAAVPTHHAPLRVALPARVRKGGTSRDGLQSTTVASSIL